ncbi:hypothetical protein ACX40Y_11685 [Sphingomonas sp. RS6]
MTITIVALVCAVSAALVLSFGKFAKSDGWRATVTPLASIIGSGFLICGPLLAREFGGAAILAEIVLLLLAYAVGWVVRFNITEVENHLESASPRDSVVWFARATQAVLSLAYAVSVAYYLKLLAEFALAPLQIEPGWHAFLSSALVTVLILGLMALAFGNGLHRVERLAQETVSIKIGIIVGLLAGLACWWVLNAPGDPLPPAKISIASIPMLLGLLITVQGFETSRYMGFAYSQQLRIRTMRHAQWIAAAIYIAFLALLTPLLGRAAEAEGVAGILEVMRFIAPAMGVLVLLGALSSQLSAAVADSIGAGGLMSEVTHKRLSVGAAFSVAGALAIAVVWLTDPFQVVAIASRAFALFYAMQCVLALMVGSRHRTPLVKRLGFMAIGLICVVAALAGAPAEG